MRASRARPEGAPRHHASPGGSPRPRCNQLHVMIQTQNACGNTLRAGRSRSEAMHALLAHPVVPAPRQTGFDRESGNIREAHGKSGGGATWTAVAAHARIARHEGRKKNSIGKDRVQLASAQAGEVRSARDHARNEKRRGGGRCGRSPGGARGRETLTESRLFQRTSDARHPHRPPRMEGGHRSPCRQRGVLGEKHRGGKTKQASPGQQTHKQQVKTKQLKQQGVQTGEKKKKNERGGVASRRR